MLTDVLKEIDNLYERLKDRYDKINNTKRCSSSNPSAYIEDIGKMFGIEESIEEILITRMHIEQALNKFLEDTMDGNYHLKMSILEQEIALLNNKLYLKDMDFDTFKKIEEKAKEEPPNN